MALNQNRQISEQLRDVFKLQQNLDGIPQAVSNQIVPVVDVNPKHAYEINKIFSAERTASGNMTLGTTSDTKDTYLIGYELHMIKGSGCDAATDTYGINVDMAATGETILLSRIAVLVSTTQEVHHRVMFPFPIKLARGSTIVENFPSFTAGTASRGAVAYCVEVDNPRA